MKNLIKTLLLAVMLCVTPAANTYAQSAAAKYDQGVALYSKGNYQGAIKLFNEAMILNKSAANKQKCQAMIDKCKKAMKPKPKPSKPVANDKLTLEHRQIYFDGHSAGAKLVGVTPIGGWKASLEHEANASWCRLEIKDGGKHLEVKTVPSTLTISRTATINVVSEKSSRDVKTLKVTQGRGRGVKLSASRQELTKINRKGEERVVTVNCQSDTLLSDGRNWYVAKAPAWVAILNTKKKNKKERVGIEKNELSLQFEPNSTKEERTGYVVIRSQEAELHIKLVQKK